MVQAAHGWRPKPWKSKFKMKDLLPDSAEDVTDENARALAGHIAARLRATRAFNEDVREEFIEKFEDLADDGDVAMVDWVIDELYDAADDLRVWID